MCGILGFVRAKSTSSVLDNDLASVAHDGMLVGALRGTDSFGYFHYSNGGVPDIHKYPVSAPLMYGSAVFDELKSHARHSNIFVGHHRAKTTGRVSVEAAHPYRVVSTDGKRVVWGVHNGSLVSWCQNKNGKTFVTDSEYLFQCIADEGPSALRDINGAYAVAFMMSDQPNKLFIARNAERTLAYAVTPDNKALLFCSEWQMMDWLTSRSSNRITLNDKLTVDKTAWADITPHNLFTINTESPGDLTQEECLKPTPKAVVSYSNYSKGNNTYPTYNQVYFGFEDDPSRIKASKYPFLSEEEIELALDCEILDEEVTGVVTKVKRDSKGVMRYIQGIICAPGNNAMDELPFVMRAPISECWQQGISAIGDDRASICFKIGGAFTNKKTGALTALVGKVKFVYTSTKEEESFIEGKNNDDDNTSLIVVGQN
jgi:predicted glutamine amidotransferase